MKIITKINCSKLCRTIEGKKRQELYLAPEKKVSLHSTMKNLCLQERDANIKCKVFRFELPSHKTVRPSSQQEYATSFTRARACCSSRDRLILTTSSYDAKTPDERSCLRSSFTRSDAVQKMLSGFPNSLQHRRSKKRERLQTKRQKYVWIS